MTFDLGLDLTEDGYPRDDLSALVDAVREMIGPAWDIITGIDHHVDPDTAPPPMVAWLADRLGLDIGAASLPRQRVAVGFVPSYYGLWGTARALSQLVSSVLDLSWLDVRIAESGGVAWSREVGGAMPGSATPFLTVTITVADPGLLDRALVEQLVRSAVPVHVPVEIILAAPPPDPGPG